jgi:ABC-type glycerol-3-phosphate transport system substrate-binding protein
LKYVSDNGRANLQTDGWIDFVRYIVRFYNIPDMERGKNHTHFARDLNLAMLPWTLGLGIIDLLGTAEKEGSLSWDMVSYPVFASNPGTVALQPGGAYLVTNTSQYKDQAFQVISHLVFDEELAVANSRRGLTSALNIDRVKSEYGRDLPVLQGKNLSSLFYYSDFGSKEYDLNVLAPWGLVNRHITTIFNEGVSITDALRNAEEELNLLIEQMP